MPDTSGESYFIFGVYKSIGKVLEMGKVKYSLWFVAVSIYESEKGGANRRNWTGRIVSCRVPFK